MTTSKSYSNKKSAVTPDRHGSAVVELPNNLRRLFLTSAGIKNTSIHNALVDLLGKPIAESSALCIPTASTGGPLAVAARGGLRGGERRQHGDGPQHRGGAGQPISSSSPY
jgi:hypothetical protein